MNLLFKITDKDLGMKEKEVKEYKLRMSARGLVINDDGKIAIQFKKNTKEYKLIGGGLKKGEEPEECFKREVFEETGCKIEINNNLGTTEEYINYKGVKQISYIFVGKVIENTNTLHLTEKEKREGAELIWTNPKEAIKLIENSFNDLSASTYSKDYDIYRMKCISLRDRKIIEYYIDNYLK